MAERPQELIEKLVVAHRILVEQRVLDAFGHIGLRDPQRPDVFWLSCALPPSRVEAADFIAFDLDGAPLEPTDAALFSERFIHAAIFRARADVNAVCHHHAASVMPFCMAREPLKAMSQTGGFMGSAVRVWDSADSFGPTRILVDSMAQADSLAAALGEDWIVLMRGHGATVAGRSIEDVVFKSVFACRDADALQAALRLGPCVALSEDEIALIGQPGAPALARAWKHWTATLDGSRDNTCGGNTP